MIFELVQLKLKKLHFCQQCNPFCWITLGCTIGVVSSLILFSDRSLAEPSPTQSIAYPAGQMTKTELFCGLSKPKGDRISLID